MAERVYKTMRTVGAGNVTLGIIIIVAGVAVGVLAIVSGARLLKRKNELTI